MVYPAIPPSLLNGAKHEDIIEPTYDSVTQQQLNELRTIVVDRVQSSRFTFTPDFKHDLPTTHWRDIYAAHRHETNVEISPDLRDTPEFDEAKHSPSTHPSNWSDSLLSHFLIARKHDVPSAANMFTNYIAWRHQFGVDDLARQSPMPFDDIIESIISHRIHYHDKDGHPLYLQRTGLISPDQFTGHVSDDVLALTHIHHMEMCMNAMHESSVKHHRRIDKLVTVIDAAHLTLSHAKTVKFFSITSFIDQHFYPEMLGALYMINAPPFLPTLLSLAKKFLDPKTSSKIFALSPNELSELSQRLGSTYIPKEWLGDCQCDNGGCIPLVDYRRQERESYVEQLQAKTDSADIRSVAALVAAGRTYTVDVELSSDVDTFWVCASIAHKNVNMSVTIEQPGSSYLLVQPFQVDSNSFDSKGRAFYHFSDLKQPVKQGKLTIKLDNSYSRFTSKDVQLQWAVLKRNNQK